MAANMCDDNHNVAESQSRDVVDFVVVANNNNNNNNNFKNYDSNKLETLEIVDKNSRDLYENVSKLTPTAAAATNTTKVIKTNNNVEPKNKKKSNEQTEQKKQKERVSFFSFGKKISQKTNVAPASATTTTTTITATTTTVPEKATESTSTTTETKLAILPEIVGNATPPRQHKFVKSSSIARLLGNTYNAKKFEKSEQKRLANDGGKFHTYSGRRRNGPYLERFKRSAKEDGDVACNGELVAANNNTGVITLTTDSRDLFGGSRSELISPQSAAQLEASLRNDDLGAKAFRTLSRGLGKLWWKRTHSVDISTPDPEFKVSYLGNVLTGWAKGEGCVEKQLNTLWRNYTQNNKPDVLMRIKVCASGLKATTRQHGLTEYWANRITYCCAPKNYPRVFCWIYRHEGRKLKHELRCHAVLCSKEKIVHDICETLKENLESALREFKREKILKQNARLSLANAVYDNPSLPRRKIMLSVGGNNYRPPLERSKSAPKLMAIEEAIGEEEGDEIEETNEPEMKSCCQKDSLYPAMTLGRRRCRRGHSIRRTGKAHPCYQQCSLDSSICCQQTNNNVAVTSTIIKTEANKLYGSDDSDESFEKLLKFNNYDTNTTLSNELLPYFDMQLHKNNSKSLGSLSELNVNDDHNDEGEPLSLLPTINSDPSADPEADYDLHNNDDSANMVALRRDGVCSDGEEDYLDVADDMYFRQAAILTMMHRNSMRKMTNLPQNDGDGDSSIETNGSSSAQPLHYRHELQSSISSNASSTATSASALAAIQDASDAATAARKRNSCNPDSDEGGSISSGCETASTVTANQDDISLKYRQLEQQFLSNNDMVQRLNEYGILDAEDNNNSPAADADIQQIYQRLESRLQKRQNSDATTYSSSSSITLKLGGISPTISVHELEENDIAKSAARVVRRMRKQTTAAQQRAGASSVDSDSECSDESGYVEYQEQHETTTAKSTVTINSTGGVRVIVVGGGDSKKPQLPPKPLPRLSLKAAATAV